MNEKPERLDLKSDDVAADRFNSFRLLFPEVIHEGKIDFNALQRTLGQWIDPGKERFGLVWPGKSECIKTIQQPSVGTLLPKRDDSLDFDVSENLIIEGDNLEVIKLLQKSYYSSVKMICIDPPYNTGNEFIYPDNFQEGLQEYLRYSGQVNAEGLKLSANTETDGRYHSNWLTMMYPRLFLARNLLREDGVIFVSIDDHEITNLRALMNEVFGEENFVGTFVWKRRTGAMDSNNNVSTDHEYVVCYSRLPTSLNGEERTFEKYSNPDNDPRGPWIADNLSAAKPGGDTFYAVRDPATGYEYWPPKGRYWPYSRTTMQTKIAEGRIIFPGRANGSPLLKRFQLEAKSLVRPVSTWISPFSEEAPTSPGVTMLKAGNNAEGTKVVKELFGDKEFTYAKPVSLLRALIQQATEPNNGDIVLDFFAGSGTTAHAVIEQNLKDGGNRRFVLVQLPERTESQDFPTIAHLTRERVRRVHQKYADVGTVGDLGFRAFTLSTSNFKVWEGDANVAEDIGKTLQLFADHVSEDRKPEDILYELLLKSGFPLTAPIEKLTLAGKEVFSVSEGALLICLDRELTLEVVEAMVEQSPQMILCLDEGFKGNDQLKVNAVQTVKSRNQNDETDIVFRVV